MKLSNLFVIYIYFANTLFSKNILIIHAILWEINIGNDKENGIVEASSIIENWSKVEKVGKIELGLKLFNTIDLKKVSAIMTPNTTVITLRNKISLKLYTDGVLIEGMNQIEGKKPYANEGLKEEDRWISLISIDNNKISNIEDLIETVNNSKGDQIKIKYISDELEKETKIILVQMENN